MEIKEENTLILVKDSEGKVTGMRAHCNGTFTIPSDNISLPRENFVISSNDAGILLAQYNPETMFYIKSGYYGTFYLNKEEGFKKRIDEMIEDKKRLEASLEEEKERGDSMRRKLCNYRNRTLDYSKAYRKFPKLLRRIILGKETFSLIEGYEKDRITQ